MRFFRWLLIGCMGLCSILGRDFAFGDEERGDGVHGSWGYDERG